MGVLESVVFSPWYPGVIVLFTVVQAARILRDRDTRGNLERLYLPLLGGALMAALPAVWAVLGVTGRSDRSVREVFASLGVGGLIGLLIGACWVISLRVLVTARAGRRS
ncbi:hypothetical protein [Streptomyces kronopolitis]|uniref:hypothetical protein n=1 Tax=Streptomyces kronopolitis TaxID=1612435 RepID=UPI003D953B75